MGLIFPSRQNNSSQGVPKEVAKQVVARGGRASDTRTRCKSTGGLLENCLVIMSFKSHTVPSLYWSISFILHDDSTHRAIRLLDRVLEVHNPLNPYNRSKDS